MFSYEITRRHYKVDHKYNFLPLSSGSFFLIIFCFSLEFVYTLVIIRIFISCKYFECVKSSIVVANTISLTQAFVGKKFNHLFGSCTFFIKFVGHSTLFVLLLFSGRESVIVFELSNYIN